MAQAALPILAIGTTVLSANAQYQQGKAIEQQSRIEADQIEANAQRRIRQSLLDAEEQRRQKRIALSNARAQQAASGTTTTSGQSLGQLGDLAGIYEFNAGEILYGGQVDAAGMRQQAASALTEGANARRQGTIGALATVLSGASSVYSDLRNKRPQSARPSGSYSPKYNSTTGFWRAPSMMVPSA